MITVDEPNRPCAREKTMSARFAGSQDMFGAMRKGKRDRLQPEGTNDRLMGYPAEGDDRAKIRQGRDRCREKGTAALDFRRQRLVLRRHTAHGIGDRAREEAQAIVDRRPVS